jgi:hypothetical protein
MRARDPSATARWIAAVTRGALRGLESATGAVAQPATRAELERAITATALAGLHEAQEPADRARAVQAGAAALKALPEARAEVTERPVIEVVLHPSVSEDAEDAQPEAVAH